MSELIRSKNELAKAEDPLWRWDGSMQYVEVAKKLKDLRFNPQPFGNGLVFSTGQSVKGISFEVESTIFDTASVIGVSATPSRRFRLEELMREPRAFCIDVREIQGRCSNLICMPTWGPAYEDPEQFASSFFFTLEGLLEDLRPRLANEPSLLEIKTAPREESREL